MKNLFVLFLLAISSYCKGQSPDYYVYLVKGEATVAKPGVKPIPVKQNSFIYKTNIINLKNGAEITLVDKDQNFLIVRSPGNNYVGDLAKNNSVENYTGVTQKYLKLLWNELLHPDYDYTKFKKENLATVYGGVSRGNECNNLIFPIPLLKTSDDSLHFKWHQTSPTSNYALLIYDSERKGIVNMAVKDTQVTLNITQALHSVPGNYYWLVKGENAGCEDEVPVFFEWMAKDKEQKFISLLLPDTDNGDITAQLQAINKLEKNAMIPAASSYYSALVKANPGNEALLKSYVLFLLKYGFDKEAYAMWQKIPAKNK